MHKNCELDFHLGCASNKQAFAIIIGFLSNDLIVKLWVTAAGKSQCLSFNS